MPLEHELTSLTEDTHLALSVPSRINAHAHLQALNNRLNTDNPPVILWNLRPWNNFTLIHAIYVERLRYYQRLGLHVVILLYDNVVAKLSHLGSVDDPEIREASKNVRQWLFRAGLDITKTEVLLESEIWQLFSSQLLDRLTAMAHSSAVSQDIAQHSSISKTVDTLCELVYESVLRTDFVLTGGREANDIWNKVRLDYFASSAHSAPSVLAFPLILTANESMAHTADEEISVFSDRATVEAAIDTAKESFIKQLFELFLIPKERPRTVYVDNKLIASYELAKAAGIPDASLRRFASERVIEYLERLQRVV